MSYALQLTEDGRISYATPPRFASKTAVFVENLPEGDIQDYLYINGEYVYSPIPKPPKQEPEPSAEEILKILLGVGS